MIEYGHFIGGKRVAGTSGRTGEVFQPMDGTVRGSVALASADETRAAVLDAKAAQPAWGATNPQRRARVLMKFYELIAKHTDELADILSREHGKTLIDAKGDIQRGVEVVEFAFGAPHLMKGEYTDGAGPGIDLYSMRQPLGVVAGITPFNFPAMIPLWKLAPAIACGNAFILKPSERDPGVPMRLAELFIEAGGPPGILNVVNGDKEAVDAILDDPDIKAIGFVGSTPIAHYIYSRGTASGKRVQCFAGAKNHMVDHARRRHGPDGRRADRRRLRRGGRALHGDLGRGAGRPEDGRRTGAAADPARRSAEDRPLDGLERRLRSAGDQRPSREGEVLHRARRSGRRQARGRRPWLHDAGLRERLLPRRQPVRSRHQGHAHLQGRDFRSRPLGGRARRATTRRSACATTTNTATASRSSPATATPRATSPPRSRSAWSASTCRSRCRSPTTPSAAGSAPASATSTSTAPNSIRFYTKTKTVTARWPSGVKEGANFSIPTMG